MCLLVIFWLFINFSAYRNSLETKKQAKVFKKNDSQREEPDDVEMDVSGPDVITLESDSESSKEDSNNENDSESSSD